MSGYPDERFGEPPVPPVTDDTIRAARRRVSLPATFLMLNGLLGVLLVGASTGMLASNPLLPIELARKMLANQPDSPEKQDAEKKIQDAEDQVKADVDAVRKETILRGVLLTGTNALAILGAVLLRVRDSRGWGYASSIISMIPLVTGCCCTGLPFGLWGLIILGATDVANGLDAARRRAKSPNPDAY